MLLIALLAATATAFPTWGASGARRRRRPSGSAAASSPAAPLLDAGSLTGALFYGTCNLPACSTLEFASWGLANGTRTDLFDFPLDSFEDGYVADNALFEDTVVISLQSDASPDTGALVTFNLTTNSLISSLKTTPCFALWPHPDAPASALLCLALVGAKDARCPAGTTDQCTLLLRVDRGSGAETLVAGLLAGYAPFTVECLDTAKGAIYSTFELLNGGLPQMVAIDARSGAVLRTVPFPVALAFLELEYSVARGRVFAVVEDSTGAKPVAYAGAVDVVAATATPLGPNSFFNVSYPPAVGGFFNQFVGGARRARPRGLNRSTHAQHTRTWHAHTHARAHTRRRAEHHLHPQRRAGRVLLHRLPLRGARPAPLRPHPVPHRQLAGHGRAGVRAGGGKPLLRDSVAALLRGEAAPSQAIEERERRKNTGWIFFTESY